MINRNISHIDIPSKGQATQAKFYADMFGWKTHTVAMKNEDYTVWQSNNMRGGFPSTDENIQPEKVVIYLESDDIEADLVNIKKNGGKSLQGKTEIPNVGWFAHFADPTGNRLGLFTRKK